MDFAKVFDEAQKRVVENESQRRTVSDDEVAAEIIVMADNHGYIPSEQIVEPIRAYLEGYGIILSGDAGIGKTFLMKCLGARLYDTERIISYGLRDIHNWYEWTDGNNICIDDLGAERVTAEYGAKEDLMKVVLAHRSERQTGRTSITTNFNSDQITARYGERTLSRILGMCKTFGFTGTNMRAPTPSAP